MPVNSEFQLGSDETFRCEAAAEGMQAYLDGAADAVLRGRVEAHLRACPSCAREMERLRGLVEDLRAAATAAPPAGLWPRIRAAIGGGGGSAEVGAGARHGSIALAAGILLALASLAGGGLSDAWTAIPAVPLLWLASTRLEAKWSAAYFTLVLGIGALPLLGCEVLGWKVGQAAPLGLCGAIATLAAAQATAAEKVRVRVLGAASVSITLRSAGIVLLAFLMARPDLIGWTAAAATAFGALWGCVAAWVSRKTKN